MFMLYNNLGKCHNILGDYTLTVEYLEHAKKFVN